MGSRKSVGMSGEDVPLAVLVGAHGVAMVVSAGNDNREGGK